MSGMGHAEGWRGGGLLAESGRARCHGVMRMRRLGGTVLLVAAGCGDSEAGSGGGSTGGPSGSTSAATTTSAAQGTGSTGSTSSGSGGGDDCLTPGASHTSKVAATPDYTQTDPAYGGFVDGNNFCGPTAASNALLYLRDNGYPSLASMSGDAKQDQHDLIVEIASPTYMNTSGVFNGTPPADFLTGLAGYLSDRGVAFYSLEWQGWVPAGFTVPAEYDTGIAVPTLDAIRLGVEGSAVAWLMLGMGSTNGSTHTISSGHWVTVVGHGVDASGPSPSSIVVHDPWTNGSPDFYTQASPLPPGQFVVDYPGFDGLTFDATGSLVLEGDWSFSSPDVYVLGLVVLRMQDDCP